MGGLTKISNGNIDPYLSFDHQTIKSSDELSIQSVTKDCQSIKKVDKQVDKEKSLGIDEQEKVKKPKKPKRKEILPTSEWGYLDDWVVEQGYILCVDGYIDYPLPIHVNDEAIADWYLIFASHGGYEPFGGVTYLFQKGEMYCVGVEWTYLGYSECHDWWMATFFVYEPFVLDSSFYPYVDSFFEICDEGLIPDKEVDIAFVLDWTGCAPENGQDFTILSVEDTNNRQFPI